MAFSCGARSAFKRGKEDYLKSMLSRRQQQGFVMLPLECISQLDVWAWRLKFDALETRPPIICDKRPAGYSRFLYLHSFSRTTRIGLPIKANLNPIARSEPATRDQHYEVPPFSSLSATYNHRIHAGVPCQSWR
jgi:hypothetical protein